MHTYHNRHIYIYLVRLSQVILEDQTTGSLDVYGCFGFIPNEATVAGVYCANRSFCTPRATKTGQEGAKVI